MTLLIFALAASLAGSDELSVALDADQTCIAGEECALNVIQIEGRLTSEQTKTAFSAELENSTASQSIFFSIGVGHKNQEGIRAILDTWAAQVLPEQVHFVGVSRPADDGLAIRASWDEALSCSDNHEGGACKDVEGLVEGYKRGADWMVLLGCDNYVLTRNLQRELAKWNPNEPQVLGILGCGTKQICAAGLCGGGGQIFSKMALKQMFENGEAKFRAEENESAHKTGMYGDLANCRVATAHKVPLHNLPGLHGWLPKTPQELQESLHSKKPATLTFHYISAAVMFKLHELVRHSQISELTSVQNALISQSNSVEDDEAEASGLAEWHRKVASYVQIENEARGHRLP